MRYTSKRTKAKKRSPVSMWLVWLVLLALGVAGFLKYEAILNALGLLDQPSTTVTYKRKHGTEEQPQEEAKMSEFERRQAEAQELARLRAEQLAAQEKAHQAELAKQASEDEAFRAWYKPSPECKNPSGNWKITVKCGNAYMDAKRHFLEQRFKK